MSSDADASTEPPTGSLNVARYIPALDGVRGICMIAVLVGHIAIFGGESLLFSPEIDRWVGGGDLGLAVFFVLSGALITHLCLVELARTGTLDLRAFRIRRVRRLGPAMAIAIIATITITAVGLRDNALPLGKHHTEVVLVLVVMGSNWLLFNRANLGYLTPTWSLTVEEQFYLVWPIALRRLWNRLGPGGTAMAALALIVAGFGTGVVFAGRGVFATYATPVSGVGILCGCLVAIGLHSSLSDRLCRFLSSTPLALVFAVGLGFVARWLHFHINDALHGGYLLFDVLTALFIGHLIVRSSTPGVASRVLGSKPLAYLGRISYGAYLYHATVYQMWDRTGLISSAWPKGIVDVVSTLLLASISFHLIEEPIRRGKWRLPSWARRGPVRGRVRAAGLPEASTD